MSDVEDNRRFVALSDAPVGSLVLIELISGGAVPALVLEICDDYMRIAVIDGTKITFHKSFNPWNYPVEIIR
mgnify:CR=1 FL=1